MESYKPDFDEELYKEALRQQLLKHICRSRNSQDVSSLDLESIIKPSSSVIDDKETYQYPIRKDSGDFLNLGNPQEVNYHKIIIERCNRNKACMCKPKCEENGQSSSFDYTRSHRYILKDVENQTSKHCMALCSEHVQTECKNLMNNSNGYNHKRKPKHKAKAKTCKKAKMDVSSSSSSSKKDKYCIPSKFEEVLRIHNMEETLEHCNERDCRCHLYDVDDNLSNRLNFQQKAVCSCIEKKMRKRSSEDFHDMEGSFCNCNKRDCKCHMYDVDDDMSYRLNLQRKDVCPCKEKRFKKRSSENRSYDTCSYNCEKKKRTCFCFKKKNKEIHRNDSEKSIQTCQICCVDKCDQTTCKEYPKNPCDINPDEIARDTQVKNMYVCSHCGKTPDDSCKAYCRQRPSTKNTIILPPKATHALIGDQADILRTLIKMEAKQNYRQVNLILQELNEQRNEIKRLIQMYYGLSKNGSGSNQKVSNQNLKKMDYLEDEYPVLKPHIVNVCEKCGFCFYKEIIEKHKTEQTLPVSHTAPPVGDTVPSVGVTAPPVSVTAPPVGVTAPPVEELSFKKVESKKQMKNIANSKSKVSKEVLKKEVSKTKTKAGMGIEVILENTKPVAPVAKEKSIKRDKKSDSVLTLYKDKKKEKKPSQGSTVKEKKTTTTFETTDEENEKKLKLDEENEKKLKLDEEKGEKLNTSRSRSKSFTFFGWCKRSLISLKERKCSKYLGSKVQQCRKNCKDKNKKSIFAYFFDFCKYFNELFSC